MKLGDEHSRMKLNCVYSVILIDFNPYGFYPVALSKFITTSEDKGPKKL